MNQTISHPLPHKPSTFERLSDWIINNRIFGIFIGIGSIVVGISIELVAQLFVEAQLHKTPDYQLTKLWKSLVFVSGHFFIIFGEATFALFFLQIVIEHRNTEAQRKLTREALDQQKSSVEGIFKELQTTYKNESQVIIRQLRENLFKAILDDLLPHEIVDPVIKSRFFESDVIKRNTVLDYQFTMNGDQLILRQVFEYQLENISRNTSFEFDIPLEVSDTISSRSKFLKCYSRQPGSSTYHNYDIANDFVKVRDLHKLKDPLILGQGESIEICQEFEIIYDLSDNAYISDYFYSMYPSAGVTIKFSLPENQNFDFEMIPAFPSSILPTPDIRGKYVAYKNIKFLATGQGFTFVLEKKL